MFCSFAGWRIPGRGLLAASVSISAMTGAPLQAAEFHWDQPAFGAFGFANSWREGSPSGPGAKKAPGSGDGTLFGTRTTTIFNPITVSFLVDETVEFARIARGDYTFEFTNPGLTATFEGLGCCNATSLDVGTSFRPFLPFEPYEAKLTVVGDGTLNTQAVSIGVLPGDIGELTVTGGDTRMETSGTVVVGSEGQGILEVLNGAQISTASGNSGLIANLSGSNGTVLVSGDGSRWDLTNILSVGVSGEGRLDIEDGGAVSTNSLGILGGGGHGTVKITGDGSTLDGSGVQVWIGNGGSGDVTVENGGALLTDITLFGTQPGSGDTSLAVRGEGSTYTATGFLRQDSGNSTILIEDGADATAGAVLLGGSDGEGTFTIQGDGSTLMVDNEFSIAGPPGSSASALVTDHAAVSAGRLFVGFEDGSSGTLEINDGGVFDVDPDGVTWIGVRPEASGVVNVTGSGSFLNFSDYAAVGYFGEGELNVYNGGDVFGSRIFIGQVEGSEGAVNVSGAGSALSAAESLLVGDSGDGWLSINNGASLFATDDFDLVWVGVNAGATGLIEVDGSGSTADLGPYAAIGYFGDGTLNVTGGADVSIGEQAFIAQIAGSTGAVSVMDGGSELAVDGGLNVGRADGASIGSLSVGSQGVATIEDALFVGDQSVVDVTAGAGGSITVGSGAGAGAQGVIEVTAGGVLAGDGLLFGDLVLSGGSLAPGASPGLLSVNGDLNIGVGSVIFEIWGNEPSEYDRLVVQGDVFASTGATFFLDFGMGFTPEAGNIFELITVGGVTNLDQGLFDIVVRGLDYDPNLTFLYDGSTFSARVGAGMSPATPVPLPTTAWLLLGGATALTVAGRKRRSDTNQFDL